MVTRFDTSPLAKPVKRADGSLAIELRLTRTGIFEYRNADGSTRRELRTPEHVFDAMSLGSFAMVPVTDDHPLELVKAPYGTLAKGMVGENVRRDGRFVVAKAVIVDPELVAKMYDGKREVSCGYTCDLDFSPGTYNGDRYDAVQTNIRGNHVAIVERGRAGAECAARMDATGAPIQENDMASITLKGIKFDVESALAQALEGHEAERVGLLSAAKADADKARDEAVAAKADADKARDEAKAAVEALKAHRDAFPAMVAERVALETLAAKYDVKPEGSDLAIKSAIIAKLGGAVPAAKADSVDFIEGALASALAVADKLPNEGLAKLRETTRIATDAATDDRPADIKARDAYRESVTNQWRRDKK